MKIAIAMAINTNFLPFKNE